jgi:hypothetical protein
MHEHIESDFRNPWEPRNSIERQPHPLGLPGLSAPRAAEPMLLVLPTGIGKTTYMAALAVSTLLEQQLTALAAEGAGAGLNWRRAPAIRGLGSIEDILGRLRRRDPATWNLGPLIDIRCSAPQLCDLDQICTAPGTWPQGGAVVAQASVSLGAAHELLHGSTSPIPVPRGGLATPSATWSSSPQLTLDPFGRQQPYQRLLKFAQAFRVALLVTWTQRVHVLSLTVQEPTTPPWPLRLLAACRRYGHRAEPSHRSPARFQHRPSAGSTLAAC